MKSLVPFWKAVDHIAEVYEDGFSSWSHYLTVNANIRADYPGEYELRFARNNATRKQELGPIFESQEARLLFLAIHGLRPEPKG